MPHIATPGQYTFNGTAKGTFLVTTTSTITAGHHLVIACLAEANAGHDANFAMSDTHGNTYTHRVHAPSPQNSAQASILDCGVTTTIPSGSTITVTHTGVGVTTVGIDIEEFDDLTAYDVSAADSWTGTDVLTAGTTTLSTAQANELVFSCYAFTPAGGAFTKTAGWDSSILPTGFGKNSGIQWKYISAVGKQSAVAASAANCSGAGAIATFKSTAGAVTPAVMVRRGGAWVADQDIPKRVSGAWA